MAIQPVFVKNRDIPDSLTSRITGLELCLAAERTAGQGSIVGAQDIRGLWRIYPATRQARNELLIRGMSVRGSVLQVSDINPFILNDSTGEEKPATKVWIADLPLSVANTEIEHSLKKIGCELRSAVKQERYRDNDNKLTRFETGRRFLFVTIPLAPLDTTLKIGPFIAKVFHREQKSSQKPVTCSKCLLSGHHASVCVNEIVCRSCRMPGHKQGSDLCLITDDTVLPKVTPKQTTQTINSAQKNDFRPTTATMTNNSQRQMEGTDDKKNKGKDSPSCTGGDTKQSGKLGKGSDGRKQNRGRPPTRQTILPLSLARTDQSRHRSQTPKRPRSSEDHDSTLGTEKQARTQDLEGTSDIELEEDIGPASVWH